MMRKLLRSTLFAAAAVLAACAAEPMVSPPTVAIPANVPASEVERIIAVQNEWTVTERKPGLIMLRYSPRDFWVNTAVTYDSQQITITYVDSNNLEYGTENGRPVIHPNYNRWVNNLAHDLRAQLAAAQVMH